MCRPVVRMRVKVSPVVVRCVFFTLRPRTAAAATQDTTPHGLARARTWPNLALSWARSDVHVVHLYGTTQGFYNSYLHALAPQRCRSKIPLSILANFFLQHFRQLTSRYYNYSKKLSLFSYKIDSLALHIYIACIVVTTFTLICWVVDSIEIWS